MGIGRGGLVGEGRRIEVAAGTAPQKSNPRAGFKIAGQIAATGYDYSDHNNQSPDQAPRLPLGEREITSRLKKVQQPAPVLQKGPKVGADGARGPLSDSWKIGGSIIDGGGRITCAG